MILKMCLPLRCCCGWQSLEHGLFIFSVVDIIINMCIIFFTLSTTIPMIAGMLLYVVFVTFVYHIKNVHQYWECTIAGCEKKNVDYLQLKHYSYIFWVICVSPNDIKIWVNLLINCILVKILVKSAINGMK